MQYVVSLAGQTFLSPNFSGRKNLGDKRVWVRLALSDFLIPQEEKLRGIRESGSDWPSQTFLSLNFSRKSLGDKRVWPWPCSETMYWHACRLHQWWSCSMMEGPTKWEVLWKADLQEDRGAAACSAHTSNQPSRGMAEIGCASHQLEWSHGNCMHAWAEQQWPLSQRWRRW